MLTLNLVTDTFERKDKATPCEDGLCLVRIANVINDCRSIVPILEELVHPQVFIDLLASEGVPDKLPHWAKGFLMSRL